MDNTECIVSVKCEISVVGEISFVLSGWSPPLLYIFPTQRSGLDVSDCMLTKSWLSLLQLSVFFASGAKRDEGPHSNGIIFLLLLFHVSLSSSNEGLYPSRQNTIRRLWPSSESSLMERRREEILVRM